MELKRKGGRLLAKEMQAMGLVPNSLSMTSAAVMSAGNRILFKACFVCCDTSSTSLFKVNANIILSFRYTHSI